MELPDGTVLMHAGRPYDPAKAREYYLRTRKLKGRKPAKGFDAGKAKVGVGSSIKKTIPTPKSKTSARKQQINEIKGKLEQLKKLRQGGKSDIAARTAAEKSVAAGKLKKERADISEEVHSVRKDLASLSETLKNKMKSGAPSSEVESIRSSIEEKKGQLEAAAEKLRNLGKATTSG